MSIVRTPLDRGRVVEAAIAHADREGLEALSMRRLAETLGVTPMALYKHIDHRDRLIDEMVDRLLEEVPAEQIQGAWKQRLRHRILVTREVLSVHGWARDALETRAAATPGMLAHLDALTAILFAGGLSAELVHQAMHALSTRMWGFTRDVAPTPRLPDDPSARERTLAEAAVDYPSIARMAVAVADTGATCDPDAEFVFALDLILDGIERRHRSRWRPPGSVTGDGRPDRP